MYEALFEPFELKHLTLKNRIISTPHGPAYADNGMPAERYQRYHEEKVKGGLGLTMFGGSSNVSIDSPSLFGQLDVATDDIIPHFQSFSERIHRHGGALMCQITHMGHRTVWDHGAWLPTVSASAVRDRAHRAFPKAMEQWDIDRIVRDFGEAARRCREGGLDGCEVSMNSHLLSQFLCHRMNLRHDDYGGELENRLRITLEVLAEVRKQVGNDYIVGVRMNADERLEGGMGADESVTAGRMLADSGFVDFFNMVVGSPTENPTLVENIPGMSFPTNTWVDTIARFKQSVTRPVFHAGRINDFASADRMVREGFMDLVGMTRAHIADPHAIAKLKRGEESRIRTCVGANYCIDRIYTGAEALCLQNAATGRERQLQHAITPTHGERLKVVVVGAGPAGLEASRVSAARGHEVVLFEASAEPGGQIKVASRASWRKDVSGIARWLADEVTALGVDVRYNTYAERDEVLAEEPDVVILATGGLPNTEICDGAEHAISVWDLLTEPADAGKRYLIYDDHGDHQGISAALHVAELGADVELVTPDRTIGEDIGIANISVYYERLPKTNVTATVNTRVRNIQATADGFEVTLRDDYARDESTCTVDVVAIEHGTLPLDGLYFDLVPDSQNLGELDLHSLVSGKGSRVQRNPDGRFQLYRIGDAVASRNIHAALHDALRLCLTL